MPDPRITAALQVLESAPPVIQIGCAALILVAFVFSCWLIYSSSRIHRAINAFITVLEKFFDQKDTDGRAGLTLERLDRLRVDSSKLDPLPREWMARLRERFELYVSPTETEGYFIVDTPRSILPYDAVVGKQFHSALFGSISGLLTAAGLTLTFIAILTALHGVNYDKTNTVEPIRGIDTLINGLSGKFLSSIVALLLSILFTLFHTAVVRKLKLKYEKLIATTSEVIPVLPVARVLLDIQRFSAKQTVSVSNISSEVVDRFTNAFNDHVVPGLASGMASGVASSLQSEFRPTMEKMAGSLVALETAIVRLESQKHESVTGEFEKMSRALGDSVTEALSKMASSFHEALSGSAQQEFGNVQGTLEATRHVLSEMNEQFSTMGAAFKVIIAKTEETTTDQLSAARNQTEALTSLMHGLMNRLQESTDQNMSGMQTHLTRVVTDLTEKVSTISLTMMDAARTVASDSQRSAHEIIGKTGEWSESTAKRLEALLGNIEDRTKDFAQASTALLESKTFLSNLVAQNATALAQMADASRNVQAYTVGLAGHSDTLKAITLGHANVTSQLRETVIVIKSTIDHNEKLLGEYKRTIQEYAVVIAGLHEPIAKIMKATSDGLRDYNQSVERNFTSIVEIADKLVPKAANLLYGQIEELGGHLEELGDLIAKSVDRADGRPR